jgi:hypothetical protein
VFCESIQATCPGTPLMTDSEILLPVAGDARASRAEFLVFLFTW